MRKAAASNAAVMLAHHERVRYNKARPLIPRCAVESSQPHPKLRWSVPGRWPQTITKHRSTESEE